MSDRSGFFGAGRQGTQHTPKRPRLLYFLVLLLAVECALLVAITGLLLYDLLVETPSSYASAIAIVILSALAAGWLAVLTVHTFAGKPWVRGAALFWQILQMAVGFGSLQGVLPRADIGWMLILPAVVVVVLLFTPQVIRATTAHGD